MEMQDCAGTVPSLEDTCTDFAEQTKLDDSVVPNEIERSASIMPDEAYTPPPSIASVYSYQLYSELEQCSIGLLEAIQALCCSETLDTCTFMQKEMATEFLERWQNVQRMALGEQVQRILGKF